MLRVTQESSLLDHFLTADLRGIWQKQPSDCTSRRVQNNPGFLLRDTSGTPLRHLWDTLKTPLGHLRDTSGKPGSPQGSLAVLRKAWQSSGKPGGDVQDVGGDVQDVGVTVVQEQEEGVPGGVQDGQCTPGGTGPG